MQVCSLERVIKPFRVSLKLFNYELLAETIALCCKENIEWGKKLTYFFISNFMNSFSSVKMINKLIKVVHLSY